MSEENLEFYRKRLDKIDALLIEVLAMRYEVIRKIAHYKAENLIPMMQNDRVKEVLKTRAGYAEEVNIPESLVNELFQLIIKYSCIEEDSIINDLNMRKVDDSSEKNSGY